jgi:hypothetical protein
MPLLSSISLSYRKSEKFFWLHQDTKQFSQGNNGNLLPLSTALAIVSFFYME